MKRYIELDTRVYVEVYGGIVSDEQLEELKNSAIDALVNMISKTKNMDCYIEDVNVEEFDVI